MRDVFDVVANLLKRGEQCALGTLVETRYSSPAPLGTTIAVDSEGRISGNIGAGCYEGEIVEACMQTLADGEHRTLNINLEPADEISGGSTCGGALRITVWRPASGFAQTACAIALGKENVLLETGGCHIEIPAKRHLLLAGATTLAQDIARVARGLDYFVTVVDPRPAFATKDRIPDADALVLEWPDAYLRRALTDETPVIVLSHDPKFDVPALSCALESAAPYIGLLGSRRSQAARRESLQALGFSEEQLARIHGPAGLDIGGRTTDEIALSILAHIVACRNARTGAPLDTTQGPIHQAAVDQPYLRQKKRLHRPSKAYVS
jgi:xanthine dehydrogenase accessory factor